MSQGSLSVVPARQTPRAVAVVCHGLNNTAEAMTGICDWLSEDTTIVLVGLAGHIPAAAAQEVDWLPVWSEQLTQASAKAQELSAGCPLYFIGYSMGGALWLHMLTALAPDATSPYTCAVLLAPPLGANLKLTLTGFLRYVGITHLPSFNRRRLRAHRWLPVTMYRALATACTRLQGPASPHWRLPVLLLIDPQDELVSYRSLRAWIQKHGLAWSVKTYRVPVRAWIYGHHLLIDKPTVGDELWEQMRADVRGFLGLPR